MAGLVTMEQMINHLRENRFLTSDTIEQHLSEADYITSAVMRQWVQGALKDEHQALEERLLTKVRELQASTTATQADFDSRVTRANEVFDTRQAELTQAFEQRDTQLRGHFDQTQRANLESLTAIQATLSEHLQRGQAELDQRVAQAMDGLTFEARRLYQEALQQAARDQQGPREAGDHGKGGGGPRERSLYDPRDYKLADLPNEPSLAAFKKWRHDLELFLETIGTSWKL
jgi:hypothetical protein